MEEAMEGAREGTMEEAGQLAGGAREQPRNNGGARGRQKQEQPEESRK